MNNIQQIDKQCIQKITRAIKKKQSYQRRSTPSLSIAHYLIITLAPFETGCQAAKQACGVEDSQ